MTCTNIIGRLNISVDKFLRDDFSFVNAFTWRNWFFRL